MSVEKQKQVVTDYMHALKTGDVALLWGLHTEDAIYNISGHMPISGRTESQAEFMEKIAPIVFPNLRLEDFKFVTKWKIMCADGQRVVSIMEAEGYGNNGVLYDQRYVHMFEFRGDLISEVWEFMDTALANAAIFTPENMQGAAPNLKPFSF